MGATSTTALERPEDPTGNRALAWLRRALPWAAWSILLVPVCIVLHELGHLLAAHAVGYPNPILHFSAVDPGAGANVSRAASGVVALALAGCVWVRGRHCAPWAAALAIAAASRFAVGVPYTVANVGLGLVGGRLTPPAFDEYKAGTALGWAVWMQVLGPRLLP